VIVGVRPGGAPASPARGIAARPGLAVESVLVGASLLGGWALLHLLRSSAVHQPAMPVLVACGGVALAAAAAGRRTLPSVLILVGVPVALLAATWVAVPGGTRDGLPTPTTVRVLHRALAAARPSLAAFSPPLPVGPGTVWLAAAVGAVAALAARALLAWWARRPDRAVASFPLAALAPVAVLVTASSVVRADATATVLATATAVLAVAALAVGPDGPSPGSEHRPRWRTARASAAAVAGAGVLVAIGAGVVTAPAPRAPGGRATVATLLLEDRVVAASQQDPGLVVFTARPAVPTYWQVATLSRFRHDRWLPGPTVSAAAAGRPLPPLGTPPPPAGGGHGRAEAISVVLHAYLGSLLPAPPGTLSVSPSSAASVNTDDGVVLRRGAGHARTLFRYTATAPVALPSSAIASGAGRPAGTVADLALPRLPPVVVALAHQVVAGAVSPLARARALLAFFATGGFRYVADPPPAPGGSDPLAWFLTTGRRGSCEEFAGAFAVLARLDGLPARVAVGFTAGSVTPDGVTVVRGRDAHAWPEVYLGTSLGWQPVEPTPAAGDGSVVPATVLRPSTSEEPPGAGGGGPGPVPGSAPTTTPPPTTPTRTTGGVPTTVPTRPTTAPTGLPAGRSGTPTGSPMLPLVLAGAVAAAAVVLGLLARRTRKWRAARRFRRRGWDGPGSDVLAAWAEVDRQLTRSGQARPPHRTATAHARAVGGGLPPDVAADLARVAKAADAVVFAPVPTSPGSAAEVVEATRRLRPVLVPGGRRRPRVR
jgi:transglutaminase-like putative cysteine protease